MHVHYETYFLLSCGAMMFSMCATIPARPGPVCAVEVTTTSWCMSLHVARRPSLRPWRMYSEWRVLAACFV